MLTHVFYSQLEAHPASRDDAITPHGTSDQWRFTPSFFDNNPSFSLGSINNLPTGYYTPNSGGLNTVYHNQSAGDLHTPGMAFQLGTPLSMPIPDGSIHAGQGSSFDELQGFNPQIFQLHQYPGHAQYPPHPTIYAPSMLVHQDSGYDPVEGSPEDDLDVNASLTTDTQLAPAASHHGSMAAPPPPSFDKQVFRYQRYAHGLTAHRFRWHITLNAPTAMIRRSDEIPMSYLNKGQAYTISIVDSNPMPPSPLPVKYRTVVRISFEDEQQRQKPSACWQLWKEGRGMAESHQRGGKLQAVEYVDPHPGAEDDPRRPKLELEKISFDSFSVIWSPPLASNTAECSVAVRFNFLSTDFSHSKGVKGIPVRLCAKTEMLNPAGLENSSLPAAEVSYCKVKLFRDHGAERKLSNDVAHVKKTIDKLKQQISQMEAGIKDSNKRKRSAPMAGKIAGERPGKVTKHKRTWSMSSQGSSGRPPLEEDLHQKLAAVQDMFTSTRPVSVLYLRGAEQDDPDLFPVALPGVEGDSAKPGNIRRESWEPRRSGEGSPSASSLVSPVPSSRSMPEKPTLFRSSTMQSSRQASGDWPVSATFAPTNFESALDKSLIGPLKIREIEGVNELPQWLEAVDVDPSYVPPAERLIKPIACFYVLVKIFGTTPADDYYRAVYLMQRTVSDLTSSIASKCDVDPSRVQRSLRVNSKGLKILVDEELVREIPEGQDMVVEFHEIDTSPTQIKQEPHSAFGSPAGKSVTPMASRPLEMRLVF